LRIFPSVNISRKSNSFGTYITNLISNVKFRYDNRLYEKINIVLKKIGVPNIETDLNTGISPRQLARLFEYYIGDSAKTISKVVRFQNILRAKPPAKVYSRQTIRKNQNKNGKKFLRILPVSQIENHSFYFFYHPTDVKADIHNL